MKKWIGIVTLSVALVGLGHIQNDDTLVGLIYAEPEPKASLVTAIYAEPEPKAPLNTTI